MTHHTAPIEAAPDEALLRLYANGDPTAAAELARRFLPRILGFATRMLHDRAEAEDVAQEAMLRLWQVAPDWRTGEAKVSTWLYRVAANLCTDRHRKTRRLSPLEAAPEPEDTASSVVATLMQADRAAALEAALAALPERQRQAVVLRHIEGMSNPEIGEVMDMSVEAVESLTARGKRALSGILAGRRGSLGYDDEHG